MTPSETGQAVPPPLADAADDPAVEALAARLDDLSPSAIVDFGREVEEEMARFADIVLDQALSREPPPLDDFLGGVRDAARLPGTLGLPDEPGFFGRLFASPKREAARQIDRLLDARRRIDTVALALEDHIHEVDHGLVVLDKLFAANMDKVQNLTRHAAAGWLVLGRHRAALAGEQAPTDVLAARISSDRAESIDRLERRVADLDRSRIVTLGLLATIRQIQAVGHALVEQLRTTIDHAIPAWKASMIVQLQTLRQAHGLKAFDDADVPVAAPANSAGDAAALLTALDKIEQLEKDDRAARDRARTTMTEVENELHDG